MGGLGSPTPCETVSDSLYTLAKTSPPKPPQPPTGVFTSPAPSCRADRLSKKTCPHSPVKIIFGDGRVPHFSILRDPSGWRAGGLVPRPETAPKTLPIISVFGSGCGQSRVLSRCRRSDQAAEWALAARSRGLARSDQWFRKVEQEPYPSIARRSIPPVPVEHPHAGPWRHL